MRYAKFIAAISLAFAFTRAFACADLGCLPSAYYMFHLVDLPEGPDNDFNINSHENCLLWRQEIQRNISLEDIYQVVYKYDLEVMTALKSGAVPEEVKGNKMVRWLMSGSGQDALDFLILAKNCEWLRRESLSPWYYPSKNDPVKYSLNDVVEVARERAEGNCYADRYALQAVRAMTSLKQYEEIINYWDGMESRIPEGLMRRMILSYVAGAYYHLDDVEQARNYYMLADDMVGLVECDLRYHPKMSRMEKMELLYDCYPDCPDFRFMIWQLLGRIEPDRNWDDDWSWDVFYLNEQSEVQKLAALCDKVLADDSPADKALWAYAATYIAHLQGDDKKADGYLKIAERTVKDQNLSDAIKVMRIFIDAQISTYDKSYEQKLFAQLRWLQQMLERDINEVNNKGIMFYDLVGCYSFYYWSDAMRCILLGTVCPKMIQQGNITLALQLANMASYSLLNESNTDLSEYRLNCSFNFYDYCCHFAEMADSLSADALMAYTTVALKPKTEFQRFLSAHSYVDSDYLNELIGTHCLREMRYADAERYLLKVSPDYFLRTNVYKEGYLNRDPFNVGYGKWNHGADAKLYFARQMNRLEQDIAAATDPNLKAMLMIDFGVGLRNSFDYCWALTQYRKGGVFYYDDEDEMEEDALTQQAMKRVDRLFGEALDSFTNDEYAAQAQLLFCNFKTIKARYSKTLVGEIVCGRCDRFVDYHAEKVK